MRAFEAIEPHDGTSVSLKVRVTSGCFHREHSPAAYALIDEYLASAPRDGSHFEFVEHESGPDLLVWLAVGAAGLGLAKSVIDLVVSIIEARREGVRRGDKPSDPVELTVRRIRSPEMYQEEIVLRIGADQPVDASEVKALLDAAIERLVNDDEDEVQ